MELTPSFLALLQGFTPVFTTPTFTTFVQIVTGWVFSQRRLFITEIIFSAGHVGDGHWSRFHRFFSHAAWDLDAFALKLAKLVVSIIAPGTTLLWAVDDTLCRRRGLTRMALPPRGLARAQRATGGTHARGGFVFDRRIGRFPAAECQFGLAGETDLA